MWLKFKWHMFITSFIPLWVAIVFIDIWDIVAGFIKNWARDISFWQNLSSCLIMLLLPVISVVIILVVLIISINGINSFIKTRQKGKNNYAIIKEAKKESRLTTEYLLSYILPLIAFDFGTLRDVILFLIFFALLAILCIKNNNLYTNIYLELRQYKIYTCDIGITIMDKENVYKDCFVLSKEDLTQNIDEKLNMWEFENQHSYIIINEEKSK